MARRGAKPGVPHVHTKSKLRMEMAMRIQMANPHYTDAQIAEAIGITPAGYAVMKQNPEYKKLLHEFKTGIFSPVDGTLADRMLNASEKIASLVPTALETLANAATQRMDKKLAVAASCEILDRSGYTSKVSRIGLPTPQQGGLGIPQTDIDVARALVEALK